MSDYDRLTKYDLERLITEAAVICKHWKLPPPYRLDGPTKNELLIFCAAFSIAHVNHLVGNNDDNTQGDNNVH